MAETMNWRKTLGIVPISALTTCFGTVAKICVTSWIRSLTLATQKCLYEFWCFGSNVVEDSVLWDTAMETSETSFMLEKQQNFGISTELSDFLDTLIYRWRGNFPSATFEWDAALYLKAFQERVQLHAILWKKRMDATV